VVCLLRALTDLPTGFLYRSISSPSVLRPTGPNFNFRLMTGLSLELFYEFLRDFSYLRWYSLMSTTLSFLR